MTRTNQLFSGDKNVLLLRIMCLFWFFAKLLSWRMWTTNRVLPVVPVFDYFDNVPSIIHTILFVISLCLLLALFVKQSKLCLMALLVVEIITCVLDQSRWLPWEYQYIFTILIFLINLKKPGLVPACIAFILVSTYFYGGASKLNEDFLKTVWDVLILKFFFKVPVQMIAQPWVHYSGYLLAIIELLAGIGLLFAKTQRWAAIAMIGMHVFILILLGPFGYRGYKVLWPWNASMIFFLYFIFLKENERIIIFQPVIQTWNKLVLLFWGILPALSFIGYWDYNLSSYLFSGNTPKMIVCIKNIEACKPLERFCFKKDSLGPCKGEANIDIQNWAISETRASAYPEVRVYKRIQQKLEKQYPGAGFSFLYYTHWNKK